MNATFTLNCYVRGDRCNQAFEVDIGIEKSVAALKEAIKVKKSPYFDHTPADSLVLWNVSVPFTRPLKAKVEKLVLADDESLQPLDSLSDLFSSELHKGNIHIVVDRPSPCKL